MDGRIYAIYTAVGNDYAELQRVGGTGRDWITLYNDGCISHGASFGNDGGYTDYEYTGGKELKEIKSYSLDEYSDIPASHGGEASISVTPINTSVEVYSCNYLGQINAPSGGPINGYATSYIVDRGAVSYTRTDLMDNWHVTAVRYCVVNGITWYELYDTDDGDYYGWLDKDHIDFY